MSSYSHNTLGPIYDVYLIINQMNQFDQSEMSLNQLRLVKSASGSLSVFYYAFLGIGNIPVDTINRWKFVGMILDYRLYHDYTLMWCFCATWSWK